MKPSKVINPISKPITVSNPELDKNNPVLFDYILTKLPKLPKKQLFK